MKLLDGIRVLDMTNVLAGPFATLHLALAGAEVIKIENPEGGDLARKLGNVPDLNAQLMGTSFLAQNTNKKSLTLNLKEADAKEIFRKLVGDRRRARGELPAGRPRPPRLPVGDAPRDEPAADLLRDLGIRPDRARRRQAGVRPDHPGPERRDGDQRRRAAQPAARRLPGVRHGRRAQRGVRDHGRALPPRAHRAAARRSTSR